jgi:hypothetical protein
VHSVSGPRKVWPGSFSRVPIAESMAWGTYALQAGASVIVNTATFTTDRLTHDGPDKRTPPKGGCPVRPVVPGAGRDRCPLSAPVVRKITPLSRLGSRCG